MWSIDSSNINYLYFVRYQIYLGDGIYTCGKSNRIKIVMSIKIQRIPIFGNQLTFGPTHALKFKKTLSEKCCDNWPYFKKIFLHYLYI